MHRQQTLPLDGCEPLDALWSRFSEDDRREVVAMYARLLARAVREEPGKENSSDDVND
jgi:hypothetical protein